MSEHDATACLHCDLLELIEEHAEEIADAAGGFNAIEIAAPLARACADFLMMVPELRMRAYTAEAFLKILNAQIVLNETGVATVVTLDSPPPRLSS